MNITVFGLTNPDVNLKRMHQLYNVRQLFTADDFSRCHFSDAFFLAALRVKYVGRNLLHDKGGGGAVSKMGGKCGTSTVSIFFFFF